MAAEIHILNGSLLSPEALERVGAKIGQVFGATVKTLPSALSLNRAYDQSRGQHNSTALLAILLGLDPPAQIKKILVVDVDLYIPVLTFVFGEAQLNGIAAIVSTHRLQNQFYGLPHDDGLMLQRLEKEIIHELGHTFGLYHCRQFECVMRSSTYVEEIDLKKAD
ncbi:MAG TPA: archaemetzincin, partial [Bacteroidota bacterium]|nr:archaemetzincin [Bacteroidota bacterium]